MNKDDKILHRPRRNDPGLDWNEEHGKKFIISWWLMYRFTVKGRDIHWNWKQWKNHRARKIEANTCCFTTCPPATTLWRKWRCNERESEAQRSTKKLIGSGHRSLGHSPGITHKNNAQNKIFYITVSFLLSFEKTPKPAMYKISMQWDENSSFGSRTFNVASCRSAVGCSRIFFLFNLLAWRSSWQLQRQTLSHYNKAGILSLLQTSLFISSRLIKENVISKCSINVRNNGLAKLLIVPHKTN